jgi:hypothetical protein
VGHHQVETRISEKTHILQCGHQEWGNEISFYNVWRGVWLYIRGVESAMVTTLFVVSSVGSSTRGLESSSEIALEVNLDVGHLYT